MRYLKKHWNFHSWLYLGLEQINLGLICQACNDDDDSISECNLDVYKSQGSNYSKYCIRQVSDYKIYTVTTIPEPLKENYGSALEESRACLLYTSRCV